MSVSHPLPRSWLFVPGDSPSKMEKARASGADALILDLEDLVAPGEKQAAREAVATELAKAAPMPRYIRVNALDTDWTQADVAAAEGADGWVLPKCEGPADLDVLARLAPGRPVLAIATETVRAVRALLAEDWTHPSLIALAWGGEDLAADLGATGNRDGRGQYHSPFLFARDAMLFAAKAAGVGAIDTVYTDFRDSDGCRAEAVAAETVGFGGKMAIHPAQVAPINEAFTPAQDRVDWARAVVRAMEGDGVSSLNGQMLDRPHLRQAQAILSRLRP